MTLIGRPNVGKSTLVNAMVGTKVTITARSPNTTRHAVRGVVSEGDVQVILVDTPGLHRPRTALGGRLNDVARAAVDGVDVVLALIDAGGAIGPGDRSVMVSALEALNRSTSLRGAVVVNKVDRVGRDAVARQLMIASQEVRAIASERGLDEAGERLEYFAISAARGTGVEQLLDYLRAAMPESPFLFAADDVSDVPEALWIAELVREQLVRKTSQELPHSIHCRVSDIEWPRVTVDILVERESQKGMVIGKGGQLLKDVGSAARRQLPEGIFLELRVAVEPSWQRRDDALDRFGY